MSDPAAVIAVAAANNPGLFRRLMRDIGVLSAKRMNPQEMRY
jgi:hypothetical protein